jgi:putative phosphoesterase
MKFLLVSDIHDRVDHLRTALASAEARACDVLICCGDLCSPFVIEILHRQFDGPVHVVFGNNDGDQFLLTRKAMQADSGRAARFRLHGPFLLAPDPGEAAAFGNHRVAAYHYPAPSLELARSGSFDLVCFGHNHTASCRLVGACLLVNPGALMGWNPAAPDAETPASFAVWDAPGDGTKPAPGQVSFFEVAGNRTRPWVVNN